MAVQDSRVILVLAAMVSCGLLFQLLSCVLFDNWWPMLVGIFYVLVPMPYLFFGSTDGNGFSDSAIQSGWTDAGKFLTGFSAVGSIAIPAVLAHSHKITIGAMLLELLSVFLLGGSVVTYDYFNTKESFY
mmetsp:Transcript_2216/g.3342  ORF Transcript_2216/g.3342 Transcript_2216/m.3342 type:complete len:130 (+) Transcript_2216:75-464(+)